MKSTSVEKRKRILQSEKEAFCFERSQKKLNK